MLRRLFPELMLMPDGAGGGAAVAEPPPPPAAAKAPEPQSHEFSPEFYKDMEDMDEPSPAKPTPPQVVPPKPEPKPKLEDEDEEEEIVDPNKVAADKKAQEEQAAKEAADKEAADKAAAAGKPVPKQKTKELKVVYEEAKKHIAELEPQLAAARKEVEQLKTAAPAAEIKTLSEQLKASETRRKELEQEIEFTQFQKSERFQKDFQTPYVNAFNRALTEFRELEVKTTDPETGLDKVRHGTAEDLVEICNLPIGQAVTRAKQLFGEDFAGEIMAHRRTIRELAAKQEAAIEEARTKATEHQEQQKAQMKALRVKYEEFWKQTNQKLQEQFPRWFKAQDGDEEGNRLLSQGYAKVDRYFNDQNLSPEERIALQVEIRGKAANHDRLVVRNKQLRMEMKKLKSELEAYSVSNPPSGSHGTGRQPKVEKGFLEQAADDFQAMEEQ